MVVPRPSLPGIRVLLALSLAPVAAGCAREPAGAPPAPPGFSADTFTREGLISGATATEAGCRALPDAIWVDIGNRRECLRYAAGGLRAPAGTAIVHFPGDPPGIGYRHASGRVHVERVGSFYEHTAASRRLAAEALAGAMQGVPVFLMARPGMHGSSGDHGQDRHTRAEVDLVNGALAELKRRYGFRDLVLSGFSSGGLLVANLLALRTDIRCAIIASAPLDLGQFHRRPDGQVTEDFALREGDLADPMRTVRQIRSPAAIFVIGDMRDRKVPTAAWGEWVAAARRQGLQVQEAEITGADRPEVGSGKTYHITGRRGLEVAYGCAAGWPPERLRQALLRQDPILQPQGRRLNGAEIRAAFAGHRLDGITWPYWGTRVTLSTLWDEDGVQSQFHPAHPDRRIATQRWWVEGDRLCTTEDGCNAVLADGRFLHVVTGEPARFLETFIAEEARGSSAPPG